jgi:uncharacterized protein (TIGR02284 family)
MASTEEVVSTLNDLIAACRDAQEGFSTAAEGVKDEALRSLLLEYSRQRAGFAGDLQAEVRRLGGEPVTEGSVAGAIHRGWLGIRAAVTGDDEDTILSECERGEDAAVANYRAALNADMPAGVRALVERQFDLVRDARDRLRTLRGADDAGGGA